MKKTILITCIMIASNVSIFGQIKKGALLLGPAFNYSNYKNERTPANGAYVATSTQGYFGGNLKAGYFLTDRTALGIVVALSNSTIKDKQKNTNDENETVTKTNIFGFGLFARAYKMLGEGKLGFFGEFEGLYHLGKSKTTFRNTAPFPNPPAMPDTDITGFSLGVRPGVVYFLTEKIGLEVSLGSITFQNQVSKNEISGKTNSNTLNANFGFNTFFLGAKFYLGGK